MSIHGFMKGLSCSPAASSVLHLEMLDMVLVWPASQGVGIRGAMHGLDDALSMASPPNPAWSYTSLVDPLGA